MPTHRAEVVFLRDGHRVTVVSYMTISIGRLVDPRKAAIETLEELAAESETTLADCEAYSLLPMQDVTPEQREADARMPLRRKQPPRLKSSPYR